MKHSREDILEGGIELIRSNGYKGTGVQHILKSLNIPKGSFYNYFNSKEDFVVESIDRYSEVGLKNHKQLLTDSKKKPIQRLHDLMVDVQREFVADAFKKSCLMDILAAEVSGQSPHVGDLIDRFFEERNAIFAECIAEGQGAGEIRDDVKAKDLAEFLLTGYSGAQLKAKTERSIRPMQVFTDLYFQFIKKV